MKVKSTYELYEFFALVSRGRVALKFKIKLGKNFKIRRKKQQRFNTLSKIFNSKVFL